MSRDKNIPQIGVILGTVPPVSSVCIRIIPELEHTYKEWCWIDKDTLGVSPGLYAYLEREIPIVRLPL